VSKPKAKRIRWLPDVAEANYAAAESYLQLLFPPGRVAELVRHLREAPLARFKAKDIFRASGLSLLGVSNSHVERDWDKIRDGDSLSPILLVRDEAKGRVVVADGYHRMCAVYRMDEDADIPCRIV
jgi:disulfide oxidoreductase YuzD